MDTDVNIYQALQDAFHIYDAVGTEDEDRAAQGDAEGSHGTTSSKRETR
jgi:hypothetical protein